MANFIAFIHMQFEVECPVWSRYSIVSFWPIGAACRRAGMRQIAEFARSPSAGKSLPASTPTGLSTYTSVCSAISSASSTSATRSSERPMTNSNMRPVLNTSGTLSRYGASPCVSAAHYSAIPIGHDQFIHQTTRHRLPNANAHPKNRCLNPRLNAHGQRQSRPSTRLL
jgi:hypothetical protein